MTTAWHCDRGNDDASTAWQLARGTCCSCALLTRYAVHGTLTCFSIQDIRSAPRTSSSSASSSVFRLTHRPSRTSTHAHNKREREKREERGKSERQRSRQSTKPELNQSPPRLLPPLLQGLSFLVPLPLLTASCSPSPSLTQRCLYSRTTRRTSRPEPMETVEAS